MKKTILLTGVALVLSISAVSQDFFIEADLVSNYIWRGMRSGNAAIQPTVGVEMGGFSVSMWGSTEFKHKNNETTLTVAYEYKDLMLQLSDIYTQNDAEESKYFNYYPRTTGHVFDLGLTYTLPCDKLPLSASWYTMIAGNDYKENDKRAWSSYIELKYPFSIKKIDMEAEMGITPWEGAYADKLNVVNLALKASKEIPVTSKFSFSIFGQVCVNPYEKDTFFVIGLSL